MSIQLIAPEKESLPKRTPNLMPFSIKYTGTAPVSTYFRPKPPPTRADPPTDIAGGSQEGTSQLSTITDTTNPVESNTNPVTTLDAISKEEPLVAAFRGRTVRGTRIPVPDGYTGVVLIGTDANKTKQRSPSPPPLGRRLSRRSGRVIHVDEDDEPQDVDMDDVDEGADADGHEEEGEAPTRTLTLASVFSSFMVWNPDIPVDEGRDEYIRSLNEWTKLSAMVSHTIMFPVRCSAEPKDPVHPLDTPQRGLSVTTATSLTPTYIPVAVHTIYCPSPNVCGHVYASSYLTGDIPNNVKSSANYNIYLLNYWLIRERS
jgi:hypothetical protein